MTTPSPDQLVLDGGWADLSKTRPVPEIDFAALDAYRKARLRAAMARADVAVLMLHNPLSLRYAAEYQTYQLFQAHVPSTYMFLAQDGPTVMFNGYGVPPGADETREGQPFSFFDAGTELPEYTRRLADDMVNYLAEIGSDSRRVAAEYINPSLTQALLQRGLEVIDGTPIAEEARIIKSPEEVECIRWAVAVAEHGIAKMREALRPGITELQLWGLLNYANLANNGAWHDGRMLASGPRTNPWLQEASPRVIESGDLVAFDTDMVGPFGYFADISRTFHCGPARPTKRQKQLYRYALDEIEHNLALVRPGITLSAFQAAAWPVPEEFQLQAYPCVVHAVGMCDEVPRINYAHRGPVAYDGVIEPGMVLCIESYIGAVGECDGVKLEQQVLVTEDGYEALSGYPWEEELLE